MRYSFFARVAAAARRYLADVYLLVHGPSPITCEYSYLFAALPAAKAAAKRSNSIYCLFLLPSLLPSFHAVRVYVYVRTSVQLPHVQSARNSLTIALEERRGRNLSNADGTSAKRPARDSPIWHNAPMRQRTSALAVSMVLYSGTVLAVFLHGSFAARPPF